MAGGDSDHLSHLVADYKAQTLAITASGCITIVLVKAIFNCANLIWGEVVSRFYLKGHIVRPKSMSPWLVT
jgi:hypothetical protein